MQRDLLTAFTRANITPTLHKLLAHCTELIRDCNDGYMGSRNILRKQLKPVTS